MRMPWQDRAGRFSALKAAVFAATLLPGLWIAYKWQADLLGPRALNQAIHEIGQWTVRFLLIALAVTPLRRVLDWAKLINVRRMLGLAGLGYALVHFALYILDQQFNLGRVASEIALRIYLTIGFVALIGLVALGATSTDAMIKRLGRNWNRLHSLVYPITALALLHHFLQAKIDVTTPTLATGFFWLLMGWRLLNRFVRNPGPLWLVALAAAAGLFTAGTEALWYLTMTGIPAGRVLAANLEFTYSIRPAWWAFAAGLAAALASLLRMTLLKADGRGNRKPASNVAAANRPVKRTLRAEADT